MKKVSKTGLALEAYRVEEKRGKRNGLSHQSKQRFCRQYFIQILILPEYTMSGSAIELDTEIPQSIVEALFHRRKILVRVLASRWNRISLRTIASDNPLQRTLNIDSILSVTTRAVGLLGICNERVTVVVQRKFKGIDKRVQIVAHLILLVLPDVQLTLALLVLHRITKGLR